MSFYITVNKKNSDTILLICYVLLTIIVLCYLFFIKSAINAMVLSGYLILTHTSIYSIFYRSLRTLWHNLYWLLISVIHVAAYFVLKDDLSLLDLYGSNAEGLLFTGAFLILFNILRLLSLLITKQEFETIIHGGASLFGNRNPNWFEWVSAVIYYICFIIAMANY